ncbi:MAG: ethanolamine utilization protein EutH, partial [Lachnospiraceae bacterium]|nr:ethanolamine utilization protein EutH [Lachnospiraceae bacterium]
MSFDQMILWVMAVGVLIGAGDKITGNHLGLGEKFDEG